LDLGRIEATRGRSVITVAQWSNEDRRDLFREASSRRGLSFDVIQKDFWVCFVLDRMFSHPEIAEGLHFKGGTSLSKCFNIIQRFSEDACSSVCGRGSV
jgi:predicted nucleotidyltransferase component of viral defense system